MRFCYRELVQKVFNAVGLDVAPFATNPRRTLLGLRQLSVRTVLDIGANTGQFARYINTIFPQAHVFCFEPLPGPFAELEAWTAKHHRGRIVPINAALGDSEGRVEMFNHVEHSPSSSLLPATSLTGELYPQTRSQRIQAVSLRTLDKMADDCAIEFVPDILIKMDVQGYEDRVIRGGAKVFASAKACLLEINLDALYERQASFNELLLLLNRHMVYAIGAISTRPMTATGT